MAKKGKKGSVKFKWTKEFIILIGALVAILTATIIMAIPSEASRKVAVYNDAITEFNSTNGTSYDTLSEDNVFEFIDYDGLKGIVSAKAEGYTYVVYGLMNDGTVLGNLSKINQMAKDNEITRVFVFKADWVDGQDDLEAEGFKKELKIRDNALNDGKDADVEKFTLLEYPTLLIFDDGNLIFNSQEFDSSTFGWDFYLNKLNRYNAKYDSENN